MSLGLYLLFFLSGAVALVYEVVWVRSFGLVFGGSHLATTTVLSVFMGGLALGGIAIGRRADRARSALKVYGLLELGIGGSALLVWAVVKVYPALYVPLARAAGENAAALAALRALLAAGVMIVPTSLMGGTLPVLARVAAGSGPALGRHLSFLYGANTLGAVAGTILAGFVLLRGLGASGTTALAIGTSLLIGVAALLLPERLFGVVSVPPPIASTRTGPPPVGTSTPTQARGAQRTEPAGWGSSPGVTVGEDVQGACLPLGSALVAGARVAAGAQATPPGGPAREDAAAGEGPATGRGDSSAQRPDELRGEESGRDARLGTRAVLLGASISGFCALGYETLWTRVLGMVIGSSTYAFTIMLVAFLTGIALGSTTLGVATRARARTIEVRWLVAGLGAIQLAAGAAALGVSWLLRDLPALAIRLQNLLLGTEASEFEVRLGASLLLAVVTMFVPAFFLGAAFPLAARIRAMAGEGIGGSGGIGSAVGEVQAWNTIGAILGAASSGFVLVYLLGVERSLQALVVLNVGAGLLLLASARGSAPLRWGAGVLTAGALAVIGYGPAWARLWDPAYFAIYRNNQRDAFDTPEKIRDALENTEVLFFHEGIDETISVIRPRGGERALLVNGKVVASSTRVDRQCQVTLGYLPTLLHPAPRRVFVLGLGTGMTLGAVAAHPGVRSITLAEIEREVAPAARLFDDLHRGALDSPKVRAVFEDGRNFLLGTRERYEVITADPIHPWTRGSAYLYTDEYYELAASRLEPGGIFCQWMPIYELGWDDLRLIVRTFTRSFPHAMLWLTHNDAELIGSDAPIRIDIPRLDRRIREHSIAEDLASVEMGSAVDFLSYFVMGTDGLRAFGGRGPVNTDDNLLLEFSAPRSVGVAGRMGANVVALASHREPLGPYLIPARESPAREEQAAIEARLHRAAKEADSAHALYLMGRYLEPEFEVAMASARARMPNFAPLRFLEAELTSELAATPRLLRAASFELLTGTGAHRTVEISAVTMRIGKRRGVVVFVDNAAREIYGQRYLDAVGDDLEPRIERFAAEVLDALLAAYEEERARARSSGLSAPPDRDTLDLLRRTVAREVHEEPPPSRPDR